MSRINPDKDYTSTWTYPLELDGWYHAHDALRADLTALQLMLATFDRQLGAGKPLAPSQQKVASTFLDKFLKFLHHHHTNEDTIAVPYLSTRFTVPDKIEADHKQLDALLSRFERSLRDLLAAPTLKEQLLRVSQTSEVFTELHQLCLGHFKEEEEGLMPLMRRHFTPKEIEKNVVSKIMRSMDGDSVGSFMRPMTKGERRAFMRQEGVPLFIRWILSRQAAKYERHVWKPFARECLQPNVSPSAGA